LEGTNESLSRYVTELGGDAGKMLPKTGLISSSFFQRAFTVWGHYFVAQFIIGIVVFCISMIVGLLIPGLFSSLNSFVK
jgi:hypothetical protein